jgi:hypothetical protein
VDRARVEDRRRRLTAAVVTLHNILGLTVNWDGRGLGSWQGLGPPVESDSGEKSEIGFLCL